MSGRIVSFVFGLFLLSRMSGCGKTATQSNPSVETKTDSTLNSSPTTTRRPSPDELPPSARLEAVLTGSGEVERNSLTYNDLMNGTAAAPVDESAFALPDEAAMPAVLFEGRLQLSREAETGGYKIIRADSPGSAIPERFKLPDLDLQFVQDGSYLIPVKQGLVFSGDAYWNYIVSPGRIWREAGDHGFARASFPFTLVERNQNCTHNGVMTFLFDGVHISKVRYQITQETCLYSKFDLWGQTSAAYKPETIPQEAALKAAYTAEVANRLPTKPLAVLANDFPDAQVNLAQFGRGITPEHMTTYGLVVNGVNYVSGCPTRYGEYSYCESLTLPSYSTAKSAFAAIALMRLGQKYGTGVYNLLIKDYVPEAASAVGDWSRVTFANALDMSTGNYEQAGFELDEYGENMSAFLDKAETFTDKIHLAFRYPARNSPGEMWIYHSSDTFILTRAMNNFLIQQEGSGADIFDFVREEVYAPLKLSGGSQSTVRTDNSPSGAPFGGYGLFWTRDDIAKLSLLLNVQHGKLEGEQLLEPGLLAKALQGDPDDRGLDTTGVPVFKYKAAFWAKQWTRSDSRQYACSFWTPLMSGYGGISVVLMPNGSIYYYFSDNNEFAWYEAVNESNKLKPMCP